ncbi:U-scoloptoxin(16)-Ssd1a-like [Musca autumnalis]|uniref:U-scoloptoxin(16)-Ssd1a-like n=1 Tax=Musca autumnalis TaxID=221902 RepID=UPI003CF02E9A
MKYLLIILLFALVGATLAAEISGYFYDPDYPGTCVYDDLMVWPDDMGHPNNGKCERIYCLNEEGYGRLLSCGIQKIPTGCKLGDVIKPDATYPDCCKREVICHSN